MILMFFRLVYTQFHQLACNPWNIGAISSKNVKTVKIDVRNLESYINPSHGVCDPLETFPCESFFDFRRGDAAQVWNPRFLSRNLNSSKRKLSNSSKRRFRWRHVNRLTLHFTTKAEIVTNGVLKVCPRLEPQRYFEAECCSGKANRAVARVSCMSVCKMRPRPKPQHHFEAACCNGIANVAMAWVSCIFGVSQGGRRQII